MSLNLKHDFSVKYNSAKLNTQKKTAKMSHSSSISVNNKMSKVRSISSEDINNATKKPGYSLLSIVFGLLVGFVILGILGINPLIFLTGLFKGSFSDVRSFGNFLASLSWLLPLGLAMVVSFKSGFFNIGATGQMMLSGIIGWLFAYSVSGVFLGWFWAMLLGVAAGTLLAVLIGWLKLKFGINEVLSSIMFNWIVFFLYKLILAQPQFSNEAGGTLPILAENSLRADWLTDLFPGSTINIGIFFAFLALIFVWIMYRYMPFGYKTSLLGANKDAAEYAGVRVEKRTLQTFALSGALAALAGSIFYLGVKQALPVVTDNLPTEGFQGITIALIGFNTPMGAFGGALFMAMLVTSRTLISASMDGNIIDLVQGIIIIFIALSQYFIIYDPIGKARSKKMLSLPEKIRQKDDLIENLEIKKTSINKKSISKQKHSYIARQENIFQLKMSKINANFFVINEIDELVRQKDILINNLKSQDLSSEAFKAKKEKILETTELKIAKIVENSQKDILNYKEQIKTEKLTAKEEVQKLANTRKEENKKLTDQIFELKIQLKEMVSKEKQIQKEGVK